MKDVWWADAPAASGVFGGHLAFGARERGWDFRSLGRGRIDFEEILRALNRIGYAGPLSVEWEDTGMEREHGAAEAAEFLRALVFPPARTAFDAAFAREHGSR
jgi:sugar phosphate isomerase/epimerase